MRDKFSDQRLPDLPNAGYSSPNQKALSDSIMLFMRDVERHRLRLLTIVIEGRDRWREVAGDVWRGLPIDTDLIDSIYTYFTLQAAPMVQQRELLENLQNPAKVRDIMREMLPGLEVQRERLRLMEKWAP